ncbi:chemotaxis protein CheC [Jeotgalibaca arthritidis]|uniref:Chemotaxis protein CheC n=1 Tax=Jeotgalibaca arthritidis TaxID=1868794 RepID=A0A6G7K9M8_9LACT|nr:chemotaxis protein CheC [Jeotgalibaca arthritidis]QII81950.1 chemotaxis protein CheC [Jeotgalibaca arthritidis]
MSEKYTANQLDILKEMLNIGGGNAATSLSKLLDKTVNMRVPVLERMAYEAVFEQIMSADTVVRAVQMQSAGDIEGMFLFVLSDLGFNDITRELLRGYEDKEDLAESAVCELVNILVNTFVQAISTLLDLKVQTDVPYIMEDMFGSLLTSAYLEELQYDENLWIFKNEYLIEGIKWESSLYFVPQNGMLEKLMTEIKF